MYKNILCQHFASPCDMRFQFVSNLRGGEKSNSAIFSLNFRRRKWVHAEGKFLLNINITSVYFLQTGAKWKILQLMIHFWLPLLVNSRSRYHPVQWNLYFHKACDWKAMLQMNTDWRSVGCCNKTWASGSDFYFEIIRTASFFTSVTMVILSCSNLILI